MSPALDSQWQRAAATRYKVLKIGVLYFLYLVLMQLAPCDSDNTDGAELLIFIGAGGRLHHMSGPGGRNRWDAIGEMNSGDGKIVDTLTSGHLTQAARHSAPLEGVTLQSTAPSPASGCAADTFQERSKLKVVILFYDFFVYLSLHNLLSHIQRIPISSALA